MFDKFINWLSNVNIFEATTLGITIALILPTVFSLVIAVALMGYSVYTFDKS